MSRRMLTAGLAVLLALLAWWVWGTDSQPGGASGGEPLATLETDHFTVQLYTRRDDEAKAYMQILEANVGRVEQLLDVEVDERPPVALYDGDNYPAGGLEWAVGRYDGQRLSMSIDPRASGNSPATLPKVALHEYVHFLVSVRAGRWAVPIWLNEGIALYAADQARGMPPGGQLIPLHLIDPPTSQQPGVDYAESYLAVRYLVDTRGADRLPLLIDAYASGDKDALTRVCDISESELVAQLEAMLSK